jgi:hypothetical protein
MIYNPMRHLYGDKKHTNVVFNFIGGSPCCAQWLRNDSSPPDVVQSADV